MPTIENMMLPQQGGVPQLNLQPGQSGELRIKLYNDNDFPVTFASTEGWIYGTGFSYTPYFDPVHNTSAQTLLANSSDWFSLGTIQANEPVSRFTAMNFALVSDSSHPGLGPIVAVNQIPAPGSTALGLVALGTAALLHFLKRSRRAPGHKSAPTA